MSRAEARLQQLEEHLDNMGGEEEVAQRFETLQLHAGEFFGCSKALETTLVAMASISV